MPITYRFDSRIVVFEMVGEYSLDEIRQTLLNALADSSRPAHSCLLINLSESQSIHKRSQGELQSMVQFLASLAEQFSNRIAFVSSKDLPFGLARMMSVGSEDRGIITAVFRTFDEARKWLLS
jgi:hypothetical protein